GAGHERCAPATPTNAFCTRYQVEEIILMSIPRPRLPQPARRVAALVAMAMLLAGCAALEPPAAVTAQGQDTRDLYDFVFIIAVVIFVLVEGLIVFAALRYRRKPSDTELPPQIHGNSVLEVLWTVIPTLIVVIMFVFSWQTLNKVDAVSPSPALTVRAVAAQFQWQFDYLAPDGQTVQFTQQAPELDLPVGVDVHVILRSKDVIHAFYVPKFLFKRDVVPGRENNFDFTIDPNDVNQTFRGQCAEFCGTFHSTMLFTVKALSVADFNTWLQTQIKSAVATPAPVPSAGSGAPAATTLDLTAHNVAYDKASLDAPANQPFVIKFTNDDPGVSHNVQIADGTGQVVFKGEIFAGPGDRQYPVPALAPGTYTFSCSVHPTMTGTLTVK
ncbi:MAG: cytochrome c oxidase subunit II, partial [Candidatus Limnocylindrales bacterium]